MAKQQDTKEVLYAKTLDRLQKILGIDKFPELAEVLVRAIHDPSDETARHVAYITYALLHQRAQEKNQEMNVQALAESVLVEIMPQYEELFLELSSKHMQALEARKAYENPTEELS